MANEIISGIYLIEHKESGKCYVGSACILAQRISRHKTELKMQNHHNQKLQRAWNKYGAHAFTFSVVEFVADKTMLIEREQYWIDLHNCVNTGYNISPTAGSVLGTKHSAETKAKISAANRGRKMSPEAIEKAVAPHRGRKASVEARAKMSATRKGRKNLPISPETRVKMSNAQKGKPAHNKGKPASPESIARFSFRNRTHSAETRAKMSAAKKGRTQSDETIAKRVATRARNKAMKTMPGKAFQQ